MGCEISYEIRGVFTAVCVIGDSEEELGAIGGKTFDDVGEGLEDAVYVGPEGSHRDAVVDYEGLCNVR